MFRWILGRFRRGAEIAPAHAQPKSAPPLAEMSELGAKDVRHIGDLLACALVQEAEVRRIKRRCRYAEMRAGVLSLPESEIDHYIVQLREELRPVLLEENFANYEVLQRVMALSYPARSQLVEALPLQRMVQKYMEDYFGNPVQKLRQALLSPEAVLQAQFPNGIAAENRDEAIAHKTEHDLDGMERELRQGLRFTQNMDLEMLILQHRVHAKRRSVGDGYIVHLNPSTESAWETLSLAEQKAVMIDAKCAFFDALKEAYGEDAPVSNLERGTAWMVVECKKGSAMDRRLSALSHEAPLQEQTSPSPRGL
jgi:hypothetical protein